MSKARVNSNLFEEKGAFLFKHLPMPSYAWQIVENDLILIDFNDAAYEITEGNIENYLKIKATELYNDQPEILEDLKRCVREKSNFFKEMKYKFKSVDIEKYLSFNYVFIPPDVVIIHTNDMTEKKLAELKLRESENYDRLLFGDSPNMILRLNSNGTIMDVNKAFLIKSEFKKEELIDKNFQDIEGFGSLHMQLFKAKFEEILNMGYIKPFELQISLKGNQLKWMSLQASLIEIEGKKLVQVIARDISEREFADQQLKESEEKFRTLTEQSFIGIILLQDNLIKYVNQTLANMFGYSIDELMNWQVSQFLNVVHPEHKEFVAEQATKKQSGEVDAVNQYQFRGIKKNGDVIWLEVFSKFINYEGKPADFGTLIDITEKKLAEEALKTEKRFTEDVINTTSDTIFVFEPETGKAIIWNKAFNDVSGYTNEEIYTIKAPESYYNEDDLVRAAEATTRVTEEGEVTVEMSLIAKDGRSIPFEYSARPFRNSDGRDLIVSYGRDITERKEAERKLRESEEKYRITFEHAADAIITTDLEFSIITWNKAAEDIYGWKEDDAIGKNIREIIPVSYPYDDEADVLRQFLEQGFWKGEVIQRRKDGNSIYILTSVSLIKDITSNPIGAVAINRDITERKKSEERIANLARFPAENPNPVLRVSIEDIIYINQAGQNLFDIKKGDKIPDKLHKYIHIALTENTNKTLELEFKGKLYSFDITPIQETGYANIYGRDITERKKAEKQLKESEQKYREAYNRANFYKDLFAHDINNIMQVINSSAELISYQLDETEKSKNIEMTATMIKKQITRAKKLVQNVIILSDLEESHQPIKLTEVCELLRNSINFMNNSFPEREINLQIESLNKRIFVQANELLQDVFENILTNAVRYNDKITVELEIKISKAYKEGKNYIKIEFRDNGLGVADDRKAIIFEKGHRILKGLKGMGLGLSLVKKILTIYDGKIWVEDRVRGDYNQGSNFILLMPQ